MPLLSMDERGNVVEYGFDYEDENSETGYGMGYHMGADAVPAVSTGLVDKVMAFVKANKIMVAGAAALVGLVVYMKFFKK